MAWMAKIWITVIDIGTGTGIWAIDFADEHPESEVIGTDLSPIQRKCPQDIATLSLISDKSTMDAS